MRVKYRILEEITSQGDWEIIGVIALWLDELPHMQLRGMMQHTVSRPIWRTIDERVDEQQLTLETYDDAFGEYNRYYRLQPEIHTYEAETDNEIRQFFKEKYVYASVADQITAVAA